MGTIKNNILLASAFITVLGLNIALVWYWNGILDSRVYKGIGHLTHFTLKYFRNVSSSSEHSWPVGQSVIDENLTICRHPDNLDFSSLYGNYSGKDMTGQICKQKPLVLTYIKDYVYISINRSAEKDLEEPVTYCEFREIVRPLGVDNSIRIGEEATQFTDTAKVSYDFIVVTCFNYTYGPVYKNYHALRQSKHLHQNNRVSDKEKPNVLFIGTDSISRPNFDRSMPMTKQILEKLGAFEMKVYNKLADNTKVNVIPLLTGKFLSDFPGFKSGKHANKEFDQLSFFWKEIKEMGYHSVFIEDCPELGMFNYGKRGFRNIPTDYYFRPFMLALKRESRLWNKSCFMGQTETEMMCDWLLDFLQLHQNYNKPFYALSFFTKLTHGHRDGGFQMDLIYKSFLEKVISRALLKNTVLVFFSDHGIRYGENAHTTVGQMDSRMPFMYLVVPPHLLTKHQMKNLELNQNRLTSPFDVYATLRHLIMGDDSNNGRHGQSLMNEIPGTRSCQNASIPAFWCACLSEFNRGNDVSHSPMIMQAASDTVEYINDLLKDNQDVCAKYKLKSVVDSTPIDSNSKSSQSTLYRISIEVIPGDIIFSTQVDIEDKQTRQQHCCERDLIFRLTKYGKLCLNDQMLVPFCHCI